MTRIVIIGGGFGGVACAKTLRKHLGPEACEIVLFNRENHLVFHPLLAEVAGASINPDAVAAPLRQMLIGVRCRTEAVTRIDLEQRRVVFEHDDGQRGEIAYDHLVIACGRGVNIGAVPGMADHAFALKSVGDALAIRAHAIQQFERADASDSVEQRRHALSFIVVGGGFSGVEVAGELNDLVRSSRRFYPNINEDDISITLVHAGTQILPEIGEELRTFAQKKMQQAGITLALNARATAATGDGIWLQDGRRVAGATIVCTVGTQASALVERIDAPKDKGSLVTEGDMRLLDQARAWAIGDCARIVNAVDGRVCPPTGQFAERQGRQVAENIVRVLRGEPTRLFSFKPLGQLCAIGGKSAVAEILGMRISGFAAWWIWRAIYLFKLPTWSRRMKVGADWAWDLVFARDLMNLRTDRTERVSRAYFRPGDYVFRQGDPALSFYALEKGEVEVVRTDAAGVEETVAMLGAGDFFGEMALVERRTRSASVRARTAVEVTVLGADVFTRLSKSIAPLQQRLAEAIRQRSANVWSHLPYAHAWLSGAALESFIEPAPPILPADTAFDRAIEIFARDGAGTLYLVDRHDALVGIVTASDLFRAVDAAISAQLPDGTVAPIDRFMTRDPVAIGVHDTPASAAAMMWSRGLKRIPVVGGADDRRVIGCVRAETLMHYVMQRRAAAATAA